MEEIREKVSLENRPISKLTISRRDFSVLQRKSGSLVYESNPENRKLFGSGRYDDLQVNVDRRMGDDQVVISYENGDERLVHSCEYGHITWGNDAAADCLHSDCVIRFVLDT